MIIFLALPASRKTIHHVFWIENIPIFWRIGFHFIKDDTGVPFFFEGIMKMFNGEACFSRSCLSGEVTMRNLPLSGPQIWQPFVDFRRNAHISGGIVQNHQFLRTSWTWQKFVWFPEWTPEARWSGGCRKGFRDFSKQGGEMNHFGNDCKSVNPECWPCLY